MSPHEVNAMIESLRSDASPQIAGFLYQFVVALEYCFKLTVGQSLYLEKYGDVAIKEDGNYDKDATDTSIEVKMYADELDTKHHNLLNTLYNWLEDDFHYEMYKHLVIYTTQNIKKGSPLAGWNNKSKEEKTKVVADEYGKYLKTNQHKIEDEDACKYKSIKENAGMMRKVLQSESLGMLLEKVEIQDNCQNLQKSYERLMGYAKVTTDNLRPTFINSLLGYIISPPNMKGGWNITEKDFSNQVQILAKEMLPETLSFPDAPKVEVNESDYDDALFVKKLRVIDYRRITEAVMDFARTTGLLTGEFDRPSAEKNLAAYQEEILRIYWHKYENAVDSLYDGAELTDDDINRASKIFLRDMLQATRGITFEPFGVTKPYFSEGMCHYMANDSEQNVKWLLEDE